MKAQYAILRFAKYKGPEIGHIESHNERTKEKYASNPDVDDVSIPQDIAQRSIGLDRAKLLAAPVETLTALFAFLGEPSHDGPLRHLVEFYPGAN